MLENHSHLLVEENRLDSKWALLLSHDSGSEEGGDRPKRPAISSPSCENNQLLYRFIYGLKKYLGHLANQFYAHCSSAFHLHLDKRRMETRSYDENIHQLIVTLLFVHQRIGIVLIKYRINNEIFKVFEVFNSSTAMPIRIAFESGI